MKSRSRVATIAALLAAGFGLLFFGYWVGDQVHQPEPASTVSTASTDAALDEEPAAPSSAFESANAPVAAKPLTSLDRYVQSTDLLELVSQLRADADAGDADAARIIAMAYDECFLFAANHRILDLDSISRDRKEPDRSIALSQRTKQLQRCGGFIDTGVIKMDVFREVDAKAAELDDSVAKMRKLVENLSLRRRDGSGPYEMTRQEIALVNSIALSKDVEAIVALSHIDMETYPAYGFAWQLVACDLGRDCGPNGYVMRHQCLYMSQCVAGDYRELIRRKFLPPDQFNVAQAREQEILQAIRRGDVSHLFR